MLDVPAKCIGIAEIPREAVSGYKNSAIIDCELTGSSKAGCWKVWPDASRPWTGANRGPQRMAMICLLVVVLHQLMWE